MYLQPLFACKSLTAQAENINKHCRDWRGENERQGSLREKLKGMVIGERGMHRGGKSKQQKGKRQEKM